MKTGQKGISSNFKSPPTFEVFFDAHKSWYVNRCSIFSRYMPTLVMDYLNCSLRLRMKYARSSIRLIGYCPSLKEKGVTGLILWLVNWRTIWHLHLAISNLFLWLLKVWVKVWCASVPPRKRAGGDNLDLLPPIWNEKYCLLFTFSQQPVSHIWPCLETIEKIPKRTRARSLIAPNPRSQFNQCTAAADKLCKTKISPFCSNTNNV